jgi:hypothetical protein
MRSRLDRFLFGAITRKWEAEKIASYSKAVHQHDEVLPWAAAAFQTIDTKATGLLTHVSMMIAGLGLLASMVANNRLEETVIIVQIAIYLVLAVGCLRCLSVFNTRHMVGTPEEAHHLVVDELIIRREIYALCNRVAIGFTIIVFVTLPLLFFWRPSPA